MGMDNGLLSMPPNSQPATPTHGGTAASQTFFTIRKIKIRPKKTYLCEDEI
jgi:hypothetical protein